MLTAVGLQTAVVSILALIAGIATSWDDARSVLIGGAAVIVPNALFALRLTLHRNRSAASYPLVFLLGEFVKIGLTVGLLVLVVRLVPDVGWPALLIGLIVAMKAPLLALVFFPDLLGMGQRERMLESATLESGMLQGAENGRGGRRSPMTGRIAVRPLREAVETVREEQCR